MLVEVELVVSKMAEEDATAAVDASGESVLVINEVEDVEEVEVVEVVDSDVESETVMVDCRVAVLVVESVKLDSHALGSSSPIS
jgi:hypothetical protein